MLNLLVNLQLTMCSYKQNIDRDIIKYSESINLIIIKMISIAN